MLIAILHFIGVIVLLAVVLLVSGSVDRYRSQKRLQRTLETASIKLDLPKRDVLAGEYNSQIAQYLAARYDADRIVNRMSDLARPAFLVMESFSYIVQLSIVAVAAWLAFTRDPGYAAIAWFALAVAIAFWALNEIATAILYLVTGRFPGEARDVRSFSVRLRNEAGVSPTDRCS